MLNASTLHCPICIEVFAGTPLLLACGHSFCQTCLRQLASIETNRSINSGSLKFVECPLCRQKTYFNENDPTKRVAKNYALEAILDDIHAVAAEPFVVLDETLRFEHKRLNALLKQKEVEIETLRKSLKEQTNYAYMFKVLVVILGVFVLKNWLFS